jgi:hypothetical protein
LVVSLASTGYPVPLHELALLSAAPAKEFVFCFLIARRLAGFFISLALSFSFSLVLSLGATGSLHTFPTFYDWMLTAHSQPFSAESNRKKK